MKADDIYPLTDAAIDFEERPVLTVNFVFTNFYGFHLYLLFVFIVLNECCYSHDSDISLSIPGKLQSICNVISPDLASHLHSLSHHRNVASSSINIINVIVLMSISRCYIALRI